MSDLNDLIEATAELVQALEKEGFVYALGGALAFGAWAVPRATMDIDLNIWTSASSTRQTLSGLYALGVSGPDLSAAETQVEDTGVIFARWRGFRLDVFLPSIPFYDEALRTRVKLDLPVIGQCWVLSAEAIAVFKLLFFRNKDLGDLERLFAIRGDKIDRSYVRAQLVDMVGASDARVLFFDKLH